MSFPAFSAPPPLAKAFLALALSAGPTAADYRPQSGAEAAVVQLALETRPSGKSLRWTTAQGASAFLTPTRTWRSVSGNFCRVLEIKLFADGAEPAVHSSIFCRDDDGVWKNGHR